MTPERLAFFEGWGGGGITYINATGGTGAAYTASHEEISEYAPGMPVCVTFSASNTGACTLNINGLGAKSIMGDNNIAMKSGEIIANSTHFLVYDGTRFKILSQRALLSAAQISSAENEGFLKRSAKSIQMGQSQFQRTYLSGSVVLLEATVSHSTVSVANSVVILSANCLMKARSSGEVTSVYTPSQPTRTATSFYVTIASYDGASMAATDTPLRWTVVEFY